MLILYINKIDFEEIKFRYYLTISLRINLQEKSYKI